MITDSNVSGIYVNIALYFKLYWGQYYITTVWECWNTSFPTNARLTALWCFDSNQEIMIDCFEGNQHPVSWLQPPSEGWSLLQQTWRCRATWNDDYLDCIFDSSHGPALSIQYAYGNGTNRRWVKAVLQEPLFDIGPSRVYEEASFWTGLGMLLFGTGTTIFWIVRPTLVKCRDRKS